MGIGGFEEDDHLSGDGLASADRINSFVTARLDTDCIYSQAQQFGQADADGWLVSAQARAFGDDVAIAVDQAPWPQLRQGQDRGQELLRSARSVPGLMVREMLADVTGRHRTQEGVAEGVQQDVAIAVGNCFEIDRQGQASQGQGRPRALGQPVDVEAKANATRHVLSGPQQGLIGS